MTIEELATTAAIKRLPGVLESIRDELRRIANALEGARTDKPGPKVGYMTTVP